MTPRAKRAHWIAAGLFCLPVVLVWLTLTKNFGIGGANPQASATFIILLTWPLMIPIIVMIIFDLRSRRK